MTPKEFRLRTLAWQLGDIDREYHMHEMAFLNRIVNAKKKAGKDKFEFIYKTLEDFFDRKAQINKLRKKKRSGSGRFSALMEHMRNKKDV